MKKIKSDYKKFIVNPTKRKPPIIRTPQILKFKRYFKIGLSTNQRIDQNKITKLHYGIFGLQSLQCGYLLLEHIDILKKFLYPKTKNTYFGSTIINLCIKLFPIRMLTQKPLQSRIGRGKGLPTKWYCKVYRNEVLIEFKEINDFNKCRNLLSLIIKKLPLKTRIIMKKELKIGTYCHNDTNNRKQIIIKPMYLA